MPKAANRPASTTCTSYLPNYTLILATRKPQTVRDLQEMGGTCFTAMLGCDCEEHPRGLVVLELKPCKRL